ncbi:MAG: sigma factor-like helix-turn-helix DNA-binding protein [Planctomycetota bacterium]
MCFECPLRRTCAEICAYIEVQLPSMDAGRIHPEDLPRIYQGRIATHAILDSVDILTERQQEVVNLYYRENLSQCEIALRLRITQQAVGDALLRARLAVGKKLKSYYSFLSGHLP